MKLREFEKIFARQYMSCGYVAGKAYHQLRPHVTKMSAYTLGARILRKESVREYVDKLIKEKYD